MTGTAADELVQAADLVVDSQFGSTAMVQRRMRVGFAAASRLMDRLEELGIVAAQRGEGARDVLAKPEHKAAALAAVRAGVRFDPAVSDTSVLGRAERTVQLAVADVVHEPTAALVARRAVQALLEEGWSPPPAR